MNQQTKRHSKTMRRAIEAYLEENRTFFALAFTSLAGDEVSREYLLSRSH